MSRLIGIFLVALLGVASCDMQCYERSVSECNQKWDKEHTFEQQTFCEMHGSMTKCARNAASECNTAFKTEAYNAWVVVNNVCTEGTTSNDVVKNDKNCNIETLQDSFDCLSDLNDDLYKKGRDNYDFKDRNLVLCRWVDQIEECVFKKFEKCNKETQAVFRNIYDASVELQKQICKQYMY